MPELQLALINRRLENPSWFSSPVCGFQPESTRHRLKPRLLFAFLGRLLLVVKLQGKLQNARVASRGRNFTETCRV